MQERETGQGRRTGSRTGPGTGKGQYENDTEGGRSMTTRSENTPEAQRGELSGRESGGGWSGYVVPYRYYGPGYRGVGYYSVMYQGAGEGEQEESEAQYGHRGSLYAQGQDRSRGGGTASTVQWGGGFAGRGPKGYQRSDERLREEVSDRLMADDQIDASDIEVQVRQGEVTLTGTVDDRWAKRRAEDCAEQVMGVRDVMNQIRVQGSGEQQGRYTGSSGTTSRSESTSTQQTSGDKSRSTEERSTGTNGRRRTTTSSR
jgi:osmotically-inducible protein OsmY